MVSCYGIYETILANIGLQGRQNIFSFFSFSTVLGHVISFFFLRVETEFCTSPTIFTRTSINFYIDQNISILLSVHSEIEVATAPARAVLTIL